MTGPALEEAIQRLIDGEISPDELAELEQVLAGDEAARLLYIETAKIHSVLDQRSLIPPPPGKVVPMDRVLARQKRRALRIAALTAAAAIVVAGVASIFIALPEAPLARFTVSPESQFAVTHDTADGAEAPEGGELAVGSRVRLLSGMLELKFGSGVRGIVRAPADFTLRNESLVALAEGTAWFEVAEGAIGFQVDTPDFLLTDLGTEFGVVSKPGALDQIHVFAGLVSVRNHHGSGQTVELAGYEARAAGDDGGWTEVAFQQDPFFTELPEENLLSSHLHWPFDSIHDGRLPARGSSPDVAAAALQVADAAGGGPEVVPGRVGAALAFGSNNDGLVSNWPGISGDQPRTVAFWIKLPEEPTGYDATLVNWGPFNETAAKSEWIVRATHFEFSNPAAPLTKPTAATRLQLMFGSQAWFIGTGNISKGEWHHVAICFGGKYDPRGRPQVQFYLDGQADRARFVSSQRGAEGPVDTITGTAGASPLIVGRSRSNHAKSCNAVLDELYIFDRMLSQDAVRLLANP